MFCFLWIQRIHVLPGKVVLQCIRWPVGVVPGLPVKNKQVACISPRMDMPLYLRFYRMQVHVSATIQCAYVSIPAFHLFFAFESYYTFNYPGKVYQYPYTRFYPYYIQWYVYLSYYAFAHNTLLHVKHVHV